MWQRLRDIFSIPELRQKILFTLLLLAIYRIGWQIPLFVVDQAKLTNSLREQQGTLAALLSQTASFAAADIRRITIFGLGIMPYISASIILQLLGSVWTPLEELRKEGEAGRKKINEYTRYLTVFLCIIQSAVYLSGYLSNRGADSLVHPAFDLNGDGLDWGWFITAVFTMTCGTIFLMWIGEQIDEFGIGNGISLLIMAGILAQMPGAIQEIMSRMELRLTRFEGIGVETLVILVGLFIAVVYGVVFVTLGKRQIQTQSQKFVKGNKQAGGGRQYLPLRLNQAGVMPIIFASTLLSVPGALMEYGMGRETSTAARGTIWYTIEWMLIMFRESLVGQRSFLHIVLYVGLIYFFSYFWTAITFNPKEMADNLRDYGSFIPGYRPGRPTARYLENVMVRITYVGAAFLSLVAIVPTIVSSSLGINPLVANFYGGTGLLIAVSVAFDLIQKIDSHLIMRNYKGLIEN